MHQIFAARWGGQFACPEFLERISGDERQPTPCASRSWRQQGRQAYPAEQHSRNQTRLAQGVRCFSSPLTRCDERGQANCLPHPRKSSCPAKIWCKCNTPENLRTLRRTGANVIPQISSRRSERSVNTSLQRSAPQARACSRSSIKSSTASMPTDSRSRFSRMPMRSRCFGESSR